MWLETVEAARLEDGLLFRTSIQSASKVWTPNVATQASLGNRKAAKLVN